MAQTSVSVTANCSQCGSTQVVKEPAFGKKGVEIIRDRGWVVQQVVLKGLCDTCRRSEKPEPG